MSSKNSVSELFDLELQIRDCGIYYTLFLYNVRSQDERFFLLFFVFVFAVPNT